jgi:hypothetical protein
MSNINLKKIVWLLLPAIFIGLFLVSSCTEEKEVIVEVEKIVRDTVLIDVVAVDTINANPDSVATGQTMSFTVQVTTQPGVGSLTYNWFATAGEFENATGDTGVWKSPDDPGVVTITVHASDGSFIGMGSLLVGVGMYVPTATPYFLADMACSACHQSKHDGWAMTNHSHAWQTLQESGHAQDFCIPCHTVGYEPTPNSGNSGYDEAAIEKFRNVQCENCHGPASDHVGNGTPDPTKITVDYSAELCATCHQGTHHPFFDEWVTSPHNFDNPRLGSCMGCHEGVAASIRLSGESAAYPLGAGNFYGGGSIAERPDTAEVSAQPHTCATCHNPHSKENPHQLRTVREVQLVTANGESPVVDEGGVGRLCMQCHHARRAPEPQIQNGYAHFGPHANPQADMLKAASAYQGVADPSFPWAGPSHLLVQNSCKTCHLNMVEFGGGPGGEAVKGHTFLPTVEACANCHGPISDFDDIPALEDFDGDGTVEGVQSEVLGLIHLLEDALIADGLDTTGVGFEGALGDTNISTFKQREAGYNLVFVEDDKSMGVHNPDYVVQLLQQSIKHLTGSLPKNSAIVRNENQVVGNW